MTRTLPKCLSKRRESFYLHVNVKAECVRVWMEEGVWNSLISKNLAHYFLSLNFLLILKKHSIIL